MSQTPPRNPDAPEPHDAPQPTGRPPRRWLRRLVVLALILLVGLVLLVALAPTIAGSGFGRRIAERQAGNFIDGSVRIDSTRFSWFGGQQIGGVKVFDDRQALVLEVNRVETDLSLLSALRGNYALGQTVVDVNLTRLQVDPEGNTNYQKLLRLSPDDAAKEPEPTAEATEVPDVSGNITVRYRGTVEYVDRIGGTALSPPLNIEPGEAVVKVTDINAAIENSVKLALRLGDAPAGSVDVAGSIDLFENNRLTPEKLVADQGVKLAGIDFAALRPLLRVAGVEGDLGGVLNGELSLKADGLSQAALNGQLTIDDASAAGLPQLNGDVIRLAKVSIPIKATRTVVDANTTLIKLESLNVEIPDGRVVLAGEVTEQALANVAAGKAPGADGWFSGTVDIPNVAGLAGQLKNTAGLIEGVQVTGGKLVATTALTLRKDKAFAKARLDLDAQGTSAGKPVAIDPVGLSLDATYTPTADPLRGLSDIALVLSSAFARAQGGGKTLDQLDLAGEFDLGRLRQQAAQFVDLGDIGLAGTGTFSVGSRGDLQKPDSDIATTARVQLAGVDVRLPGQPPVNIGALDLSADSTLRTDGSGGIGRVASANVKLTSGDSPAAQVLELVATATDVDLASTSVARFELTTLAITDLPRVQQQFGAFVPALQEQGLEITDGQFYANVQGTWDGKSQTLTLLRPFELSTPNLTVRKAGQGLLNRERINARALGVVSLAGGTTIDLGELAVTSSLFTLNKAEAPLKVRLDDSGAVTGSGQVRLTADLARVAPLAQAFGATPANGAAPPPAATVRSGNLAATIDLAGGIGAESTVGLAAIIEKLTVATPAGAVAMQDEEVKVQASARTAADLSALSATAGIESGFATVNLSDVALRLATAEKPVGTYDMVQSLSADVGVGDLPKLWALASAFIPPAAPEPGAAPVPPLDVTGGAMRLKASVRRDGAVTRVQVPELQVSNLAMVRGAQRFAFDPQAPIDLKLAADLDASGEQIRSLKVTQLAGDLGVARLAMPAPLVVTDVLTSPRASGEIDLQGRLQDVAPLLAVLQGTPEPLPYGGAFRVRQTLANAGDAIDLKGGVTIDDFAMYDPASKQWTPLEKQLAVRNDLSADLAKANATVREVSVEMPQTRAMSLRLVGGVNDWVVRREMRDVRLDLTYDLSKLWPIVLPLLDPETQKTLADARAAGAYTETFTVRGSLPGDVPFHEGVKQLLADGQLRVDLFDGAGLRVERLTLPVSLRDGRATIAFADRPREQRFPDPAICNGGTLNLNGFAVDLASPDEPRLYGPRRQRLLHNVTINPVLGDSLGKYVNPVFANSERAKGLLDVTIDHVEGVAMGERLFTPQSGKARIGLSITDLDIANPLGSLMFGRLAGALSLGGWSEGQADTFRGEIRDAVVTLDAGRTTQELTITLKEDIEATDPVTGKTITVPRAMPLSFSGDIRLDTLSQRLAVSLPSELVGRFIRVSEKDMVRFFPKGVPIALRGTTTKPEVDLGNIVQQLVEAQVRTRLIPGRDDGGEQRQGDRVRDAIGDLLGGNRDRREGRPR